MKNLENKSDLGGLLIVGTESHRKPTEERWSGGQHQRLKAISFSVYSVI